MWNIGRLKLNCHRDRKHHVELRSVVFLTGFPDGTARRGVKAQIRSEAFENPPHPTASDPINTWREAIRRHQRWWRRYLFPDDRLPSSVPQHWKTRRAQMLVRPPRWSSSHAVFMGTKRLSAYWVTDNGYLLGRDRKTKPPRTDARAEKSVHAHACHTCCFLLVDRVVCFVPFLQRHGDKKAGCSFTPGFETMGRLRSLT